MVRAPTSGQRGGMLAAAVCALAVAGLIAFAAFALGQGQRTLDHETNLASQLDRIETALANFVAVKRRLPCPADSAGAELINTGTGQCTDATQAINGIVPWVTLGLSEADATDPWQRKFLYRVQPSLVSNLMSLMNMSWCDTAGDKTASSGTALACTPACTGNACMHPSNYLYNKGLPVQDGSGGWLNQPAPAWNGMPATIPAATGAAYVLVSRGVNGAPENNNGAAITSAPIFIDRPRATTPTVFDDVLRHPALDLVLGRANLGPRTPH